MVCRVSFSPNGISTTDKPLASPLRFSRHSDKRVTVQPILFIDSQDYISTHIAPHPFRSDVAFAVGSASMIAHVKTQTIKGKVEPEYQ